MEKEELTYDDLADLYRVKTGSSARIKPMNFVLEWALSNDYIVETETGGFITNNK